MKTIYTALGWRLTKIKDAIRRAQLTDDPGLRREQYDRINGYLREMNQLCVVNEISLDAYLQRHGLKPEKSRNEVVKSLTINYATPMCQ